MNTARQLWTTTDGWIPPLGDETVGFLNASSEEAHVQIFIYYGGRNPVGPYHLTVPAERIKRVRFNSLTAAQPTPRATGYASTIQSDVPIVVQHPGVACQQSDGVFTGKQ
jgi:hypothetical protein